MQQPSLRGLRLDGLEQQPGDPVASVILRDVEVVDVDEEARGERREPDEARNDSDGLVLMERQEDESCRVRTEPGHE